MKSDLIITRFKTEPVIGTKNTFDPKTYFGSKMIDIEDEIIIDNSNIQYSEIVNNTNPDNDGYQYFDDIDNIETIKLVNLKNLKLNNHNINLLSQNDIDLNNNTQWGINIKWKNILLEYIFYQLKRVRTFKCIKYTDTISENINYYIREYIKNNILNKYSVSKIDLYIEYVKLDGNNENIDPNLLFNPLFDYNVKSDNNLIKNINVTTNQTDLTVNYKQTKSSEFYKFNYYFDLFFMKI